MNGVKRFYGLLKKEFWIENRFKISVFNKLFLGPILNVFPAIFLYSAFFHKDSSVSLGEINADNVGLRLMTAVLIHTFLNTGYYTLSSKIISESAEGTLSLLWMIPGHPLLLLVGTCSMEIIRCLMFSFLGIMAVILWLHLPAYLVFQIMLVIPFIFLIGIMLGLLRSLFYLSQTVDIDIFDYCYRGLLFTACLYLSKTVLPKVFWPFCDLNPIYHAGILLNTLLERRVPALFHWPALISGTVLLIATGCIMWNFYRVRLLERV